MKEILKELLPPILIKLHRHGLSGRYGYFGNYRKWEDAISDSGGYDADAILNKVKESLLKVKNGEAAYERDSVLFDSVQLSWPLLAALLWIASKNGNKLSLIDYGGSLGSSFYQNRRFILHLNELIWNIVEQPKFVDCGKCYFEDDHLKFYYTIDECLERHHPCAIIFSSVLPYLERPYEFLKSVIDMEIPYIIIDRTPFIEHGDDRLTVQKVPPSIYNASYPAWFFNQEKFLNLFSKDYELVAEFDALAGKIDLGNNIAHEKGFIFSRSQR